MTSRGPFEPKFFCDSVLVQWGAKPNQNKKKTKTTHKCVTSFACDKPTVNGRMNQWLWRCSMHFVFKKKKEKSFAVFTCYVLMSFFCIELNEIYRLCQISYYLMCAKCWIKNWSLLLFICNRLLVQPQVLRPAHPARRRLFLGLVHLTLTGLKDNVL